MPAHILKGITFMNHYIVHIYREMRLTFGAVEAETPEAAAVIARDMPTGDADDITDCEGESFAALVDRTGDGNYANSRMIDFDAERRLAQAAPTLLDALTISEGFVQWAFDHGADREATAAALHFIQNIIARATAASPPWEADESWSVLLLYPDYASYSGTEAFYAFVKASDALTAVDVAQRQAMAAVDGVAGQPDDFFPLLVTRGHHPSEPLFNK